MDALFHDPGEDGVDELHIRRAKVKRQKLPAKRASFENGNASQTYEVVNTGNLKAGIWADHLHSRP